ncbi:hypothetical protein P389DRAFT_195422 [Cystobasidium minutum MCA 4210]|uniref:uncharacterized protein n=1 Tax=Cystobasidium minutum MCA 4210 TaxID=1397322 RepID=UPI0034CECA92|eukprot:jgi/Rhomi1/195422/gm1.3636_g
MKEHESNPEFQEARKSEEELKGMKNKQLREYYIRQNELLDYFQEVDELLSETTGVVAHTLAREGDPLLPITRESTDKKAAEQKRKDKIAINVNFIINVFLLLAKVLVVILSNSLSLLASAVDSTMDLVSVLIIFFTTRAAGTTDMYNYPAGKNRMEPLGVVVFSVVMITSFSQILVESIQRLADRNISFIDLPYVAIGAMVVTVLVKAVVWLTYRSFESTGIRALSQDAQNDVVFNIFSLLFPFVGHTINWVYLDPLGALILSVYIIQEWIGTLWECVRDLVGHRADPIQHQRIIYLVTRFSPLVKAVQFCNVYSAGGGLIVEIDVLLPRDISLPKSHDICESIQYSIESLEGIQRAYVHADYNTKNPSGHQVR